MQHSTGGTAGHGEGASGARHEHSASLQAFAMTAGGWPSQADAACCRGQACDPCWPPPKPLCQLHSLQVQHALGRVQQLWRKSGEKGIEAELERSTDSWL